METFTYKTRGTCSRAITFEVDKDNKIHSVQIVGGCPGNTTGVERLCEGRDIDEVAALTEGILCRNGTSCPDQLAKAIKAYKDSKKQ